MMCNHFLKTVVMMLGLALLLTNNNNQAQTADNTITIGVIAYRGVEKTLAKWQATIDHLQSHLSHLNFVLIPMSLEQLYQAIENNELQLVLSNPGFYYTAKKYGLTPLTSLINKKQGQAFDQFGAIIFTRADRKDINQLSDVKGKSFAAVSKLAFGGFQMAWREFKAQGIDPFTDFKPLLFTGFPQDDIVLMVEQQAVDVGTVRTDILERMEIAKIIKISNFKVLNQQNYQHFPFLLSTRLYPDYVMSTTKKINSNTAERIRWHLIQIRANTKPALAGNYIGWTDKKRLAELFAMSFDELIQVSIFTELESDKREKYQGIDQMMRELNIGPYANGKAKLKVVP